MRGREDSEANWRKMGDGRSDILVKDESRISKGVWRFPLWPAIIWSSTLTRAKANARLSWVALSKTTSTSSLSLLCCSFLLEASELQEQSNHSIPSSGAAVICLLQKFVSFARHEPATHA
jgi:hypothetical protein